MIRRLFAGLALAIAFYLLSSVTTSNPWALSSQIRYPTAVRGSEIVTLSLEGQTTITDEQIEAHREAAKNPETKVPVSYTDERGLRWEGHVIFYPHREHPFYSYAARVK